MNEEDASLGKRKEMPDTVPLEKLINQKIIAARSRSS